MAEGTGVAEVPAEEAHLLPVRMLNEFVYCKRLFHLMHVEGRWEDNRFTLEGKQVHRRVDQLDHVLPEAVPGPTAAPGVDHSGVEPVPPASGGDDPPVVSRSVNLGSERLGLIAKLDLVSTAGDEAVPVETKRGRVPDNEQRSYEPERVQLMAQGLLLREHGYRVDHGILYFAGSRTRVQIPFTPELEAATLAYLAEARGASATTTLPPPLEDSPKCAGCSLNAICLPDETLALQRVTPDPAAPEVRRLYPAREDATPFYIQEQGAFVGKSSENLIVKKNGVELGRAQLKNVSQVVLCGNVQISSQTVHLLCESGVPVVYLSMGHWFYGVTQGITLRNAYDRAAQFEAAASSSRRLQLAKQIVRAKGTNQRTILRRNGVKDTDNVLTSMSQLLDKIDGADEVGELLGLEGNLAAHYFGSFSRILRPRDFGAEWDFASRNRRPPKDPINCLLSFGYALLAKECTVALLAEGLDPYWGLYHRPRHGRPALALDLMEEFRPLVVDSAILTAVNTGMLSAADFTVAASGCQMKPAGRKSFLRAYESRLDQLVTHPIFDYRCSWRAVIRLQAKLLARWFRQDVPQYTGMVTR